MSFYNVKPVFKFAVQNDDNYTAQHVQFLRSGFQQPFGLDLPIALNEDFDPAIPSITANQLLNRYNVIPATAEYILPYASDIIEAIKSQPDVRALAQDSSAIVPTPGFYWDVCFTAPEETAFLITTPNALEGVPTGKGRVTLSNCDNGFYPIAFPFFAGEPGEHVWVRFTLVNLNTGSLEVNASVLTNTCPLLLGKAPSPAQQQLHAMIQTFNERIQKSRQARRL